MRTTVFSLILMCCACASQMTFAQDGNDVRFVAVEIYLDSDEPVAAWQFDLKDRNGLMKVIGVENGENAAFGRTPYYDRQAVRESAADRIIVADFSLAEVNRLPTGRTRIATLHLMLTGAGEPAFNLNLITANTYDGKVVDASISLESPIGSEQ